MATDEQQAKYPPFVVSAAEKARWDVCAELAESVFEDLPESERATQVWAATRAYYTSPIPTGDESERLQAS